MPQIITTIGGVSATQGAEGVGARLQTTRVFGVTMLELLHSLGPSTLAFAWAEPAGLVQSEAPFRVLDAYGASLHLVAVNGRVRRCPAPDGTIGFEFPSGQRAWLNLDAPLGGSAGYFVALTTFWRGLRASQTVCDLFGHQSGAGPMQLQVSPHNIFLSQGATVAACGGLATVVADAPLLAWASYDSANGSLAVGVNDVTVAAQEITSKPAGTGFCSVGGGLSNPDYSFDGWITSALVLDGPLHGSAASDMERARLLNELARHFSCPLGGASEPSI